MMTEGKHSGTGKHSTNDKDKGKLGTQTTDHKNMTQLWWTGTGEEGETQGQCN